MYWAYLCTHRPRPWLNYPVTVWRHALCVISDHRHNDQLSLVSSRPETSRSPCHEGHQVVIVFPLSLQDHRSAQNLNWNERADTAWPSSREGSGLPHFTLSTQANYVPMAWLVCNEEGSRLSRNDVIMRYRHNHPILSVEGRSEQSVKQQTKSALKWANYRVTLRMISKQSWTPFGKWYRSMWFWSQGLFIHSGINEQFDAHFTFVAKEEYMCVCVCVCVCVWQCCGKMWSLSREGNKTVLYRNCG